MLSPDYYHILEISSDADLKAIKAAYRRLARQYHPDTQTDDSSEERMKQVNEAYAVLSASRKRAAYDRKRKRVVFSLDLSKLFNRLMSRFVRS
jgi:curved DNA-binding protein